MLRYAYIMTQPELMVACIVFIAITLPVVLYGTKFFWYLLRPALKWSLAICITTGVFIYGYTRQMLGLENADDYFDSFMTRLE